MHPTAQPAAETDAQLFVAATSGLIALVGGAFSLRGVEWARWLLDPAANRAILGEQT